MNSLQRLWVPKDTGTLSDTLLAFGLARVVADVAYQMTGRNDVTLEDTGSWYIVDAGVEIEDSWLDAVRPFEQAPFISSPKQPVPDNLKGAILTRDIDREWEQFREYQAKRKQLVDAKTSGAEMEQLLADAKPQPDWTVVTYLGDYRMQAQAIHNNLVVQWRRCEQPLLGLNLRTIFEMFAAPVVDREAIIKQWKKATKGADLMESTTASQMFNPHMGKGQNRAKANGLAMSNEKSFWLLEYLKVIGLWTAAAPRNATNADLRKTYILAPRRLRLAAHNEIFARFRDRLWNSSSIKLDITSALLYTTVALEYSVETEDLGLFGGGSVQNLVSGMEVASYVLLSQNSYTMMNLASLGIPDWAPKITSLDQVERFKQIVEEHLERIQSIDEEKSEGAALLQTYRDFVAGGQLRAFFDFAAGYSSYLISAIERSNFYVKPFTETNLRRLLEMKVPKLTPILENQGFRNVADAIRRSTVIPQYVGRKTSSYDVRYGLGQDLKRKSQYADDFIRALSDFMQSYNEENARVYERTKGKSRRKAITTEDIADVVALVDEYGPQTICNLLVAFGYARDPKAKEEEVAESSAEAAAASA
ncbi:MAG TPA: hypothetical protein GYA08_13765 [Chloroflexi bacterium]|nr:hypothetical protein [Chloroflexota bacterium]